MTDAERVPETMPGDALLAEVRSRGYQMVIVVDEYGGTAGSSRSRTSSRRSSARCPTSTTAPASTSSAPGAG